MNKKLPEMFVNEINEPIGNNNKVFHSSNSNESNNVRNDKLNNKNVNQKINDVFNSSNYIYKADVELKLEGKGLVTKRIVGKNANYLITIDNELIPISSVLDIRKK
jgi:hypothetical protein